MASKGTACPKCGYVFRKWGVSCPVCRYRFDDWQPTLQDIAKKHYERMMKKAEETKDE